MRTVKDAQAALNNRITEYGELPLLRGERLTEDFEGEVRGEIVAALLGEPVAGNKRAIQFLDMPLAKPMRAGLVDQEGELRVAVFSAGKDKMFFTKDDLVSWR